MTLAKVWFSVTAIVGSWTSYSLLVFTKHPLVLVTNIVVARQRPCTGQMCQALRTMLHLVPAFVALPNAGASQPCQEFYAFAAVVRRAFSAYCGTVALRELINSLWYRRHSLPLIFPIIRPLTVRGKAFSLAPIGLPLFRTYGTQCSVRTPIPWK